MATRKLFIYNDSKNKPVMAYFDRPFPYGIYLGHFDTIQEVHAAVEKWKDKAHEGIPLCNALIDWRKEHGMYDMEGLQLINEYEIEVK